MRAHRILSAAIGYKIENVAVFVNSISKFINLSDLVLFVEPESPLLPLKGLGISVITCKSDGEIAELSPTAQRYFFFNEYLKRKIEFEKVMISDIRDVLFQGNPFESSLLDSFDFLYPLEERSIGTCSNNSRWIRERYGAGVLRELRGTIVSCCGTVLGERSAMVEYVQKMCDHLAGAPTTFGIDQGVHNYIVNKSPVRNQAPLLNGLSDIFTLHYTEASCHRFNEKGLLLNYNNTIPRIVHQYDRILKHSAGRFHYLEALSGPLAI
jgi:hypothetical protein